MSAFDGKTVQLWITGNRQVASISGTTARQLVEAAAKVKDDHSNFRWTLTIEQGAEIEEPDEYAGWTEEDFKSAFGYDEWT